MIDQDSANKKSRQNEKKIDAAPRKPECGHHVIPDGIIGGLEEMSVMPDQYRQYRQTAKPVQGWKMQSFLRS
jgi:hypothetical protein